MPRLLLALSAALSLLCGCTPHVQLRGTGPSDRLIDLEALAGSRPGDPIREEIARRSIERYEGFTLGVIELSDDGHVKDEVPEGEYAIPLGKARIARAGGELTVIAYGSSVHLALRAAEELEEDIEVLDLRSLCPLDHEAVLDSVRKTGKALVAHEATRSCGVGAEVAALITEHAFEDLDAPVRRLTAPDVPIPFSPPLEQATLPQLEDMKEACSALLAY